MKNLIQQLQIVSKEFFNKKDFINAGKINIAIDALTDHAPTTLATQTTLTPEATYKIASNIKNDGVTRTEKEFYHEFYKQLLNT